jgi:serine protease
VRGRAVTLRWRGSDSAPDGVVVSGVARYEVWRSVGGRRASKLLTTRATARRVKLRPGRRYAFFTVAVDRAGNREAPPRRPDAVVRTRR